MLYLASKSPRRRELLQQLGVPFQVLKIDIDETWDGSGAIGDFMVSLALDKARAGKRQLARDDCVLAADTEVVIDDQIQGKPRDETDAVHMLQRLSGRTHQVLSAVALIDTAEHTSLNISRVSFKPLTLEECRDYCKTGEPLDKAGAYAIQGLAAAFITRLEGSYSGVMGLPLFETRTLLKGIGIV